MRRKPLLILCLFLFLSFPVISYSSLDNTPPTVEKLSGKLVYEHMEDAFHSFFDSFIIESQNRSLKIELFCVEGKRVPSTLFKHHRDGVVIYEIGHDLKQGLYLVKLSSEETTHCFKMVKMK